MGDNNVNIICKDVWRLCWSSGNFCEHLAGSDSDLERGNGAFTMRSKKILLALACTCIMSAVMVSSGLLFAQEKVTFPKEILITHFSQPAGCGTKREHLAVFQEVHDGTQQGSIPEGAQRAPFS